MENGQTDTRTDGHRDSMTDPAQRAESVNIISLKKGYFGFPKKKDFFYPIVEMRRVVLLLLLCKTLWGWVYSA